MVNDKCDVSIELCLDDEELLAQAAADTKMLDDLVRAAAKARRELAAQANQMLGILGSITGIFTQVLRSIGITLEPIQEGFLAVIMSTMQTLQSVFTAYASMGPVGWVSAAIIGAVAIIFNLQATTAAMQGMKEARIQLTAANNTAQGINILLNQMGRIF